jgi:hypothetical protein
MKLHPLPLVAALVILSACTPAAPSENTIQTAVAQTLAAQITPLGRINLDSVPFQDGDLPNHYGSGQVVYQWPEDVALVSVPENVIAQKVGWDISSGWTDDYAAIALFSTQGALHDNFTALMSAYEAVEHHPALVGDRSTYVEYNTLSGGGYFVFTHCGALVAIKTVGADMDEDLLSAYAQRIDRRLTPLICH